MSIEVTMPRLSDTMEAGTIIKWNVGVGDEVAAGDVLADIETDKATMEMQAFDDGVIAGLLVDEGKQVPVGTTIAVLAEEGESAEDISVDSAATTEQAPAQVAPSVEAVASSEVHADPAPAVAAPILSNDSPAPVSAAARRMKISPVARRMAEEKGIDLSAITGSGPGGRIIKRDIIGLRSGTGAPSTVTTSSVPASVPGSGSLQAGSEELSGMRQTIARRLVESKSSIPHYQVSMSVDMKSMVDVRSQVNERLAAEGAKASVNDFIVKAAALAIRDHKYFNASFAGDKLVMHGGINVGVAIALPEDRGGGLVVGTIRNADALSVRDIADQARQLSEKARTRGLSAEDMSDSTFTISNLGMFGVDHFTAIINPPNSAIMACGAALEVPVVDGGEVVPGLRMTVTLSLDHRVIDGAMAARFLQTLKLLLEKPAMLLV